MFKRDKDAAAKSKASMRGKEVKALKARLLEVFGWPGQEDDGWVDALVGGAMEVWKVGVGDRRTTCVARDGVPVLFDAEPSAKGSRAGSEAWCPTLEALWRVPGLVPAFLVPYQVTKYVCQGADLMLPGTRGVSRRVGRGQVCAVIAQGNPMPVAVGISDVDSDTVDTSGGGRGRAVAALHWYGDMMWQVGLGARMPNPAFRPGFVKPLDGEGGSGDGDGDGDEDDVGGEGGLQEEILLREEGGDNGEAAVLDMTTTTTRTTAPPPSDGSVRPDPDLADSSADSSSRSSEEQKAEMDALLERCLLQVIRTRAVKESQLPLDAALFYSGFMRPLRPRGTNLDVKLSTHKKLLTFLKAMEFHGVVMLKQQPGGQTLVTDLDARHERVRAHVPWEDTEEGHAVAHLADGEGEGGGGAPSSPSNRVRVETLYKPHRHMQGVWSKLGLGVDDYLTHEGCKEVLRAYVRDVIGHTGKGGGEVTLDSALSDALFGGVPAEKLPGGFVPSRMGLKSLSRAFDARLQQSTRVTGGTFGPHKSKVYKGSAPPAITLRPAKRHNHNVTVVSGLEQYGIDPHAYADELAKLVAASCSVDEIATVHDNNKPRGEVIVGGHREVTIAKHLASEFGIPAAALAIAGKNQPGGGKKKGHGEKARDVLPVK